jgi:hypothetical protein
MVWVVGRLHHFRLRNFAIQMDRSALMSVVAVPRGIGCGHTTVRDWLVWMDNSLTELNANITQEKNARRGTTAPTVAAAASTLLERSKFGCLS